MQGTARILTLFLSWLTVAVSAFGANGRDPALKCKKDLKAAAKKTYRRLRSDHIADYCKFRYGQNNLAFKTDVGKTYTLNASLRKISFSEGPK